MTKTKRKLIFFWTYLEWGGAQIYLIAIMKVVKPDWDILVVLPRGSSPEILRFLDQTGVAYDFIEHHLDVHPAASIKRKIERQIARIRTEIESFRYLLKFDLSKSILHIEAAPWQSWIFLTCLCLRRANVFVTLHNALPPSAAWREFIWKLRMQFISRLKGFHVFASNNDTKNKFRRFFDEKFWERIRVIHTCVNPDEIKAALAADLDRSSVRDQFGLDNNKFIVLCVAQFIDRKGRWTFLDAAKIVTAADPNVDFVWLTPTQPNEAESKKISEYGLGGRFRLMLSETVGQTRVEILRFFRVGDIFAHPSVIDGLPIAILESMAMGLPTISTNVYAIPEAIRPNETGLLIESQNPDQLAAAIIKLKSDSSLREQIAAEGQRFVLENFDERVAAASAIAAYKECFADAG